MMMNQLDVPMMALVLLPRKQHFQSRKSASSPLMNGISLAQADDGMSLALGLSLSPTMPSSAQPNYPMNQDSNTMLQQITNDNFREDFKLTEAALEFVGSSLEKFVTDEQMDLAQGNLVSSWLLKLNAGRPLASNPLIETTVLDLDYIYNSFYGQFRQLIQSVLYERPPELGIHNLAFRCERRAELVSLQELVQSSSIYRMILDIFFSELYTHCLKRKLATIRLTNVKPSSVLRQFVDIYMDLPTQYALASRSSESFANDYELKALEEVKNSLALNFNLEMSLKRHGPMERTAELVFDKKSALAMGVDQLDTKDMIGRFLRDCHQHALQLGQLWGEFDLVASFLSSPMNDLAAFNEKIKTVAPQLLYGSVCGQLARTVAV